MGEDDQPHVLARKRCPDSVVLLENEHRNAGERVGGAASQAWKPLNQAKSGRGARRDRTQEVAGSSPANSIKNRRKSAVSCWEREHDYIQALGSSDAARRTR
jgi:hypothetical protein